MRNRAIFGLAATVLLVNVGGAWAQESRGAMTGRVVDATGAVIIGAHVTATHADTNTPTAATTNDKGLYFVGYLIPGIYSISVEAAGFKKLVRSGIEVRVGDTLSVDLSLEAGGMEETVEVLGSTPLLERTSASSGQVIDHKQITELPLPDGVPFTLARLAAGVADSSNPGFTRPADNASISRNTVNGVATGNEFTLDGAPDMSSTERTNRIPRVGFSPMADAIQEFKVATSTFDAQQGHTAGGVINVVTKSGTNRLHGSVYEFNRDDSRAANNFFLKRAGQPKGELTYNRFGGTVGGPVVLPGFDGRNKTFFFFGYEGLRQIQPEPGIFTVPTPAERNGDFSALLPLGIQFYDPRSAHLDASGRIVRDPFPNNVIPADRISPIARKIMSYYPQPNQAATGLQGENNFVSPQEAHYDYDAQLIRLDHVFNDRHRLFLRVIHNKRIENRFDWAHEVNGLHPTGELNTRTNWGLTIDQTSSLNSTMLLNVRVGFERFLDFMLSANDGQVDLAALGFSPNAVANFQGGQYLPYFDLSNFSDLGRGRWGAGQGGPFYTYFFQPTVTKQSGAHFLRAGYDLRVLRENNAERGQTVGSYVIAGTYMTERDGVATQFGQDLGSFLLGVPTGGFIDRNGARSNETVSHGLFVQDDWRMGSRLTLNLGLRYEYESPTTERYNRNVRGLDLASPSPIEAQVRAAYANSPIPEIPVDALRVRGGLRFATADHRGFWNGDKNNIMPRFGVAFSLNDKTVLRGGWGLYTVPLNILGIYQAGFSQRTDLIPTVDKGLTFLSTIENPFPSGAFAPTGGQDLVTNLGRALGNATNIEQDLVSPLEVDNGRYQRWEVGVQRQLFGDWVGEARYSGSRGRDLLFESSVNINGVPRQYLSTSRSRDQATLDFLNATVANPFKGLLPGTALDAATTTRSQLLRPYPQFPDVFVVRDGGSTIFHSAQLRLEKRFSHGHSLLASYTWSKLFERIGFLNPTDPEPEKRIGESDRPHRFVMSSIVELPFGRGRKWGSSWPAPVEVLLGGWQLQGVYQIQSGNPLTWSSIYYEGDPFTIKMRKIDAEAVTKSVFIDPAGFYFHDSTVQTNGVDDPGKQRADRRISLSQNLRYFPTRIPALRNQGRENVDFSLMKKVSLSHSVKLQLRVEFLNAFNQTIFGVPDRGPTNAAFGLVTTQLNLPRDIQIGAKLTF